MIIRSTLGATILEFNEFERSFDFSDQIMDDALFEDLIIEGAIFVGASLKHALIRKCDLYWSCFTCTDLSSAVFDANDLRGASFRDATCVGTCFKDCDLGVGNMGVSGAIFNDAKLSDAKFHGCNLVSATFNSKTIFPIGFIPQDHGMVLRDS